MLVAPPGAGKTTAVAPALLGEAWVAGGEILLLSPRRLAARAAAERMAALAGEPAGRTYGYRTRLEAKTSAATRVTVVTEGIFVARIQADPELAGVAAVLFDEVHERSLDGDTGLAFALDVQASLRPDLRLVAMSATLDGARFAGVDGRRAGDRERGAQPYSGAAPSRPRRRRADRGRDGGRDLPGAGDGGGRRARLPARRRRDRAGRRAAGRVARHHRAPPPARQPRPRRAARGDPSASGRPPQGRARDLDRGDQPDPRRHPRRRRFGAGSAPALRPGGGDDPAGDRAGKPGGGDAARRPRRAARGRGWPIACGRRRRRAGLPRFDPPEMLEADLSALVLATGIWGVADPRALAWLDPPPPAAIDEARARLAGAGGARRRRAPDRAWPRRRRAADAAAPRPYADPRRATGIGRGRGRSRGAVVGTRAGRQRRRCRGAAAALARRARRQGASRAAAGGALGAAVAGVGRGGGGRGGDLSGAGLSRPGSRAGAMPRGKAGRRSAAAASGSTRPRRSRARNGSRSARR